MGQLPYYWVNIRLKHDCRRRDIINESVSVCVTLLHSDFNEIWLRDSPNDCWDRLQQQPHRHPHPLQPCVGMDGWMTRTETEQKKTLNRTSVKVQFQAQHNWRPRLHTLTCKMGRWLQNLDVYLRKEKPQRVLLDICFLSSHRHVRNVILLSCLWPGYAQLEKHLKKRRRNKTVFLVPCNEIPFKQNQTPERHPQVLMSKDD